MLDWLWVRMVGRPRLDWIVAFVITGAHLGIVLVTGRGDVLGWPEREQRVNVYTATATVAAIVGSFITAAIAQYAASTGQRMRTLRTHPMQGPQFRRNWVSILGATLVVSGLCLLATVLDITERDTGGVHWLAELAMALGIVRATRLVWLFGRVIVAGDADLADARPSAGPNGT